jgi:Malectin domain/Pectate lyase superfamily protein
MPSPNKEHETLFLNRTNTILPWAKRYARAIIALTLTIMSIGFIGTVAWLTHTSSVHAATGGAGATIPYIEMPAYSATTNGKVIGPSFVVGDLAADAVNRRAVTLTQGQYVQFTLPQAANSINVRYSIPDSATGGGINATINLYVNGNKQTSLPLTSQYSWVYGLPNFGNCYGTWNNTPGTAPSTPHHMYDEVHTLLPQMAAGTTVKLQVDSDNTAQWYTIDIADFEQVADPVGQPSGYISVTDSAYGADPTGKVDATRAIQNAVNAGSSQGKGVYIPRGTYLVTDHINVNNVTLTGAGIWYTILAGGPTASNNTGVGIYGQSVDPATGLGASTNVHVSNLAINGQISQRYDCYQENGFGGAFSNSTISDVWIEHTKVGMWFDGPFSGLTVTRARIYTQMADGINFHQAISNSSVNQSIIRGTGDDGLAMWSDTKLVSVGDSNNTFDHNTVQSPFVANCIAIYGGTNITVTNNRVSGSEYRGGGINIDYQFFGSSTATFQGTINVSNNTIIQGGGFGDQGVQQFGALMFWAYEGIINTPITASNIEIDDSMYAAIQFDGTNSVGTVAMSNINVNGAEFVFNVHSQPVNGSASNITASNITVGSFVSVFSTSAFNVTLGSGNSGWSLSSWFNGFPTPTPPGGNTATPTFVTGPTSTPTTIPPTATPIPPIGGTLVKDVNAGGSAAGNFAADAYYDTGNAYSDTSSTISTSADSNPAPQAVYQTCRWNSSFTYTIPGLVSGSQYTVLLHWAELTFQSAGARTFNVAINGNQILSNFDVFAAAGYKAGTSRAFTATANGSGQIVIAFSKGTADNPFISGIEIISPQSGPTATPTSTPQPVTAINAGGGASGSYVADTDYNQGNQYSDTSTAINTGNGLDSNSAPQSVYQTCRWNSSFTYTIPGLTAGATYTVRLHWAELTFQSAGARTFNVAINGSQVLSNFDVFATAGYKVALGKSFTATANSNGQIVIAFTQGTADNPFISGIEIAK